MNDLPVERRLLLLSSKVVENVVSGCAVSLVLRATVFSYPRYKFMTLAPIK